MNVLSLFDGISAGRIALERAGVDVGSYYAAEIDKYAIKVTQANYPDTIQLGDVTNWREWDIDWSSIDLLIGGSPCQGFSFAGKQLAFDDPRSKLFFVYVDILNHIRSVNPDVKFMLENVKMKREYLGVISEQLGVEPVFINSALVSAQNRQRYYWANWKFGQPEDEGVVLADILDYEHDHKWICAKSKNPEVRGDYLHFDPNGKGHSSQCNRVNLPHTKHKSLSGTSGGNKHGVAGAVMRGGAIVGRKIDDNGKRNDSLNQKPVQCLEAQDHGKSRCLSTVAKDTIVTSMNQGRYESGYHYRKLTTIECERLQTFPDNYTNHVSNTQRYKALGNSWTVDVVAHIFNHLS